MNAADPTGLEEQGAPRPPEPGSIEWLNKDGVIRMGSGTANSSHGFQDGARRKAHEQSDAAASAAVELENAGTFAVQEDPFGAAEAFGRNMTEFPEQTGRQLGQAVDMLLGSDDAVTRSRGCADFLDGDRRLFEVSGRR